MLRNKNVRFKKIYKFYFDHFLIKCTVFVLIVINTIKNQKFNFKKLHKFYMEHFLIEIIVFLIKLGNLHQKAKRYETRNTEREAREENV